jgi:hypothetical protein
MKKEMHILLRFSTSACTNMASRRGNHVSRRPHVNKLLRQEASLGSLESTEPCLLSNLADISEIHLIHDLWARTSDPHDTLQLVLQLHMLMLRSFFTAWRQATTPLFPKLRNMDQISMISLQALRRAQMARDLSRALVVTTHGTSILVSNALLPYEAGPRDQRGRDRDLPDPII